MSFEKLVKQGAYSVARTAYFNGEEIGTFTGDGFVANALGESMLAAEAKPARAKGAQKQTEPAAPTEPGADVGGTDPLADLDNL